MGVTLRSALGKRIRRLADTFAVGLGGWAALTDIQVAAVRRAAELAAIAETARARMLAGDQAVSLDDLVRVDAASDRALRRLGIKPGAPRSNEPDLATYLANLAAQEPATPEPEPDGEVVQGDETTA
jgi:hypothetical protein